MRWLLFVLVLSALISLPGQPARVTASARLEARPHREGYCDRCGQKMVQMRVAPDPPQLCVVCYAWRCPRCVLNSRLPGGVLQECGSPP